MSWREGEGRLAGWLGLDQGESGTQSVMCSRVGAAGVYGSRGDGSEGRNGDDSDEDDELEYAAEALCLEVRPWLRNTDATGEGRWTGLDQLVRPALLGRKAHREVHSVDYRVRDGSSLRERNRDRNRERRAESVESDGDRESDRERGSQRERGRDQERDRVIERDRERPRDSEGRRRRTQSLSDSNSFPHQTTTMESAHGLDRLQRGLPPLRPHSTSDSQSNASNTSTNSRSLRLAIGSMSPALSRPPIRSRTAPLSPRRLSPRAAELYRRTPHTSREPDAFWLEVRTGARGIGRPSPRQRTQTRLPSHTSQELGEEEEEGVEGEEEEEEDEEVEGGEAGGSGVVEVVSQTLTQVVPSSPALGADRRMSKRERNRMKSLRRRQRRRERWRQTQLQENRQVRLLRVN